MDLYKCGHPLFMDFHTLKPVWMVVPPRHQYLKLTYGHSLEICHCGPSLYEAKVVLWIRGG